MIHKALLAALFITALAIAGNPAPPQTASAQNITFEPEQAAAAPAIDSSTSKIEALERRLDAIEPCNCSAHGLTGGPGFITKDKADAEFLSIEQRCTEIERQNKQLQQRVAEIERRIQIPVSLRQADGTVTASTAQIDTVAGWGDFSVPPGGRVVAINGVPVRQAATAGNVTTYSAGEYRAAAIPQRRAIRIFPRLQSSGGTCRIINGRMVCN